MEQSQSKVPVMVLITLPDPWPVELMAAIPAQRKHTQTLLAEGVVQSYSVSADRTQVWMVVVLDDADVSVHRLVADFPIEPFVTYTYEPLMFTNDSSSVMHYSLN